MVWSKSAQKYKKDTALQWEELCESFIVALKGKSLPLTVSFTFVRNSRHKFDYVNPLQTVLDIMVHHQWIEDDNADVILPVFEPYIYDKNNPGVIIKVL